MEPPMAKNTGAAGKKRRRGPTGRDLLPADFLRTYNLPSGGELGRGAFAVVRRCVLRAAPHEERAAKIIDMRPIRLSQNPVRMERVKREAAILKQTSHPNIVRLHDVYENLDTLVIVMELVRGKELFFEILERNHMMEDEARPIFQQLCEAVAYLHGLGIVHRDIKPENILVLPSSSYPNSQLSTSVGPHPAHPSSAPSGGISTVDNGPSPALPLPPPLVKLLDFGLSKLIDPKGGGSSAKTFVGTRAYLAPEVELLAHGEGRDYGRPADCWSLGAVLFVALVGKFPEFDVVHKVHEGVLTPFSGVLKVEGLVLWDSLSATCKDLIKRLMTPNAEKRLTAAEALEHPWTRGLSFLPADYRPPAHRGVDFSASARTSTTSSSRQSSSSCYTSGAVAASFTSAGAVADGGGSGGGNNCGAQAYHHGQQHQRMQQSGPGQLLHPASCIGEDHGEWRQRQWQEEGQTAGVGGSNIVRHNNWQQQPPPQHLQQENAGGGAGAAAPLAPTSAMVAATRAVAVAADAPQATVDPLTQAPVELRLGLLVKIQGCIASSLGLAFHLMLRSDRPRVAAEMVQGALVCQRELHLTIRLLRKVSDTAALVLALFPDLQLALREGEMTLARSFFVSIKNWIQEIRLELQALQRSNEQAMAQMARIIKKAARELVGSHKLVQHRERERREQRLLSDRQRSEGQGPQRQQQQQDGSSKKGRLDGPTDPVSAPASASAAPLQQQQGGGGVEGLSDEDLLDLLLPDVHCEARRDAHTSSSLPAVAEEGGAYERKVEELTGVLNDLLPAEVVEPLRVVGDGSARQLEDRQVAQVVICLRRLDRILELLESFYAKCELGIDTMIRRSDHLALLTSARTAEMRARLDLRLAEYGTFWTRVQVACQRYLAGVNESVVDEMYAYLKDEAGAAAAAGAALEGGGPGFGAGDDGESHTSTDAGSHSVLSLELDMDVQSASGERESVPLESNDD